MAAAFQVTGFQNNAFQIGTYAYISWVQFVTPDSSAPMMELAEWNLYDLSMADFTSVEIDHKDQRSINLDIDDFLVS